MLEATVAFKEKVRAVWGNPLLVARAGINEIFNHGDEIGLDYDDQVDHVLNIGLLAGMMKDDSPDEFIAAFEKQILNDE